MPADSNSASIFTLTESLLPSLYQLKDGRRHQALSDLWPCDSVAANFELLTAGVFERVYPNGLFYEPTQGAMDAVFARSKDGRIRILDLGSGATATWCVSMAEMFPEAHVTGIDLIPSDLLSLPPNLDIEIHDLLEGLPYPEDYFDLIHCRYGSTTGFFDNLSSFIPELARALKPGGAILIEDIDDIRSPLSSDKPDDPALKLAQDQHTLRVSRMITCRAPGRKTFVSGAAIAERVRETDVLRETTKSTTYHLPMGIKPDDADPENSLGALVREAWMCAWNMNLVQLGLDEAQIREILEADREAMPEEDVGLCFRFAVVWATKRTGEAVS